WARSKAQATKINEHQPKYEKSVPEMTFPTRPITLLVSPSELEKNLLLKMLVSGLTCEARAKKIKRPNTNKITAKVSLAMPISCSASFSALEFSGFILRLTPDFFLLGLGFANLLPLFN